MQGKNRGNQTRFKTTLDKFDIDDVRFEDEGVITCRAENVFGAQETKVELTVLGECAGFYLKTHVMIMIIGVVCIRELSSCHRKKKHCPKKSEIKGIHNLNDLRGIRAVALTTVKAAI